MTPEERIEMAELHDLYDKHTTVWCNPEYKTAFPNESSYCTTCGMPLFKGGLVNSAGQDIWKVGVGISDRRLMLSMNRPFARHLGDMKDKHEVADIMAALLLWHVRVQGMENPPMYYCSLASQIGADSPDFRRVIKDCGGWLAYDWLANNRDADDEAAVAEMRKAALNTEDPKLSYNMAVYIDLEPRQDTWDIIKQHDDCCTEVVDYKRWMKYPRYKHIALK